MMKKTKSCLGNNICFEDNSSVDILFTIIRFIIVLFKYIKVYT